MSLPNLSAKKRALNRANALIGLLWPFLALVAVVALLSAAFTHTRPRSVPTAVTGATRTDAAGDWLSATSPNASVSVTRELQDIPGKGATTVTTYTVFGTY